MCGSVIGSMFYAAFMPSQLHEALLLLFRNRPELAPELLHDALHMELPAYTQARVESADFNVLQPTEYRADLVILLLDDVPVLGIIVEVQLSPDPRKQYVWPAYIANLRARLECPVCLLVVAAEDSVARWAATPLNMGVGNSFVPMVIGPSGVPEITDEDVAKADPELAVLSAMAHGKDLDFRQAARIADVAQLVSVGLDDDRSTLYVDLIKTSLSKAARRALKVMRSIKYEYQSDFARKYFGEGREAGERSGRSALLLQLLTARFGSLSDDARARIEAAPILELEKIGERLLTAHSVQEALG